MTTKMTTNTTPSADDTKDSGAIQNVLLFIRHFLAKTQMQSVTIQNAARSLLERLLNGKISPEDFALKTHSYHNQQPPLGPLLRRALPGIVQGLRDGRISLDGLSVPFRTPVEHSQTSSLTLPTLQTPTAPQTLKTPQTPKTPQGTGSVSSNIPTATLLHQTLSEPVEREPQEIGNALLKVKDFVNMFFPLNREQFPEHYPVSRSLLQELVDGKSDVDTFIRKLEHALAMTPNTLRAQRQALQTCISQLRMAITSGTMRIDGIVAPPGPSATGRMNTPPTTSALTDLWSAGRDSGYSTVGQVYAQTVMNGTAAPCLPQRSTATVSQVYTLAAQQASHQPTHGSHTSHRSNVLQNYSEGGGRRERQQNGHQPNAGPSSVVQQVVSSHPLQQTLVGNAGRLFGPYTKFSYNCADCGEPFPGLPDNVMPTKQMWLKMHIDGGSLGAVCIGKYFGHQCFQDGSLLTLVDGGVVKEMVHCSLCNGKEIESRRMTAHFHSAHGGRMSVQESGVMYTRNTGPGVISSGDAFASPSGYDRSTYIVHRQTKQEPVIHYTGSRQTSEYRQLQQSAPVHDRFIETMDDTKSTEGRHALTPVTQPRQSIHDQSFLTPVVSYREKNSVDTRYRYDYHGVSMPSGRETVTLRDLITCGVCTPSPPPLLTAPTPVYEAVSSVPVPLPVSLPVSVKTEPISSESEPLHVASVIVSPPAFAPPAPTVAGALAIGPTTLIKEEADSPVAAVSPDSNTPASSTEDVEMTTADLSKATRGNCREASPEVHTAKRLKTELSVGGEKTEENDGERQAEESSDAPGLTSSVSATPRSRKMFICKCGEVRDREATFLRHLARHTPRDEVSPWRRHLCCPRLNCEYVAESNSDYGRHCARHVVLQQIYRRERDPVV